MPEHRFATTVVTDLTPSDIAKQFAAMDDTEQALFWEALANLTDKWDTPACFQWQMMRDRIDDLQLKNGLRAFSDMAQYAT